ncbi:Phage holin protein [compost metagenome]
MHDILLAFLQDIAYALASIGAAFLIAFLKKKIGVAGMQKLAEQSYLIKEVVRTGVKYAEQAFQPGEKAEKAVEWIVTTLGKKGIIVTEEEIKGLVEATVREFKDEFGENWANAVKNKEITEETKI